MEIVQAADGVQHEHKWLEWLGLEEPPPDVDSWVPVARAFGIDERETGSSSEAARLIEVLKRAGIEGQQRSYYVDLTADWRLMSLTSGNANRVAVFVHERDLDRARGIATTWLQKVQDGVKRRDAAQLEEIAQQALRAPSISDE